MQPAIAWSQSKRDSGADFSVEGRLLERAGVTDDSAAVARRDQSEDSTPSLLMRASSDGWSSMSMKRLGSEPYCSVIVFVFAQPDSVPAKQLIRRRAYFDIRTGDKWDVFFPGYFRYGSMNDPIEVKFDEYWGFSPKAFDAFRRDLEERTNFKWRYSGGSDLVILNVMVLPTADILIDFDSILFGSLSDPNDESHTLTLAQVIELISTDLESSNEDEDYGVGKVVKSPLAATVEEAMAQRGREIREVAISAASAILASIGEKLLGLS